MPAWNHGTSRRALLTSASWMIVGASVGHAATVRGSLPWEPDAGSPPEQVKPGPWTFFTPREAADVEELVDRLIPPDPGTPGGKGAGCAVYIDRQLSGPYGSSRGLYMRAPFHAGSKQGEQSPLTPAQLYRQALAALDKHCHSAFVGKAFAQIPDEQKDKLIKGLEDGSLQLEGSNGRAFFEHLLKNTKEGFFADPVYGGNRDMVGWKMIGFPGARYDYRDWIGRHNERYPLPPVGITGRPEWVPKGT